MEKTTEHVIPNDNEIFQYYHCGLCLADKPLNISPRDWARLEVGATPQGIQVWCKRHECNVIHIDFAGQKFHANTTRKPE